MFANRERNQKWAELETAKVCGYIMDQNYGIQQQVIENKTDLLDILTVNQLKEADDIGMTPIYQAVFYDRPEIIKYLYKRGLDLAEPCDPEKYGKSLINLKL